MSLLANLKGQRALSLHSKGRTEEALPLYEAAYKAGMNQPRLLLAYATLLIRNGDYMPAKELLVSMQKAPGITPDQKSQLFMDYAVCCFKLGDINKGIRLLEKQHAHQPSGLIYETLGYLYAEKFDTANHQSWTADIDQPDTADLDKALAFCLEAIDYDEDDAIAWDNLGQLYERAMHNREKSLPCFQKAIELKPGQIDTLWFLSRFDLEQNLLSDAAEKLETALDGRFSPLNMVSKDQMQMELDRIRGLIANGGHEHD